MLDKVKGSSVKRPVLAVPLSILIRKKCVDLRIPAEFVKSMHMTDLQCLILRMEIQNVREHLAYEEKQRLQKQGISQVKDIEGAEVLRFLGR